MKWLLALCCLPACATAPASPTASPQRPIVAASSDIRPPVASHRLENGLEVYLLPDHSAPLVSVQVWVRVGSVDEHEARPGEPNGITGLSHFFEHLMFQGTERYPSYDLALAPLGAKNNAFTFNDATVYWAYTPREHLRTILDIEADRFAHIKVDFIHLEPEREVVRSERRQRLDADPAELAEERAVRNTFDVFPYRWGPIGWMTDLDSISLTEAQRYHAQHYRPDNAYLVIAGDFDAEQTLAWVRELWGPISAPPTRPTFAQRSELQLRAETWTGPRTDHIFAPASQTSVFWSYRAPAPSGTTVRDYAALELIDWALTGGKSGRLARRLLFSDPPQVSSLSARLMPLRFPYAYIWRMDLLPGTTTEQVELALEAEIEQIAQHGLPEDELAEAVASLRSDLVRQNLSHSDKGEVIGFALSSTGSPFAFHERLALYGELSSADIAAAARAWLSPAARSRVTVVPYERVFELVAALFEGHAQAGVAEQALQLFATSLELTSRERELERERKAIELLEQRAQLALTQAEGAEAAQIRAYLSDNEMGTVKRTARLQTQRKALDKARRDLSRARIAVTAALEKAKLSPGDIHRYIIRLLVADPSAPPPLPPKRLDDTVLDAAGLVAHIVSSLTLDGRGLEARAQAARDQVLANASLVDALPAESQAVAALAIALARDLSRTNLSLSDRALPASRQPGAR